MHNLNPRCILQRWIDLPDSISLLPKLISDVALPLLHLTPRTVQFAPVLAETMVVAPSLLVNWLHGPATIVKTKLFRSWDFLNGWGSSQGSLRKALASSGPAGAPVQGGGKAVASLPNAELTARDESQKAPGIWLTVLIDNTVQGRDLQAEHGLSIFVRTERECVLFDTGQTDLLLKNASALELPLAEVNAIVLSHGHYDHTGGLKAVHEIAPGAGIYVHPDALKPKFAGNADKTSRPVGLCDSAAEILRDQSNRIVWTEKPTEVAHGLFVTGTIPRRTAFEDTGGRFHLDEACACEDPLLDDQALFFDTNEGLVVLLGCGHAGVVNTVEYVRELTPGRPICAVIGGFHLLQATQERMEKTIDAFRRWDLQRLAPAHCTGLSALMQLSLAFPDRCFPCPVGASIGFQTRGVQSS